MYGCMYLMVWWWFRCTPGIPIFLQGVGTRVIDGRFASLFQRTNAIDLSFHWLKAYTLYAEHYYFPFATVTLGPSRGKVRERVEYVL